MPQENVASLEFRNASCLATPLGASALRGPAQGQIRRIHGAALRIENGLITFVGEDREYARQFAGKPAALSIDASGKTLLPGFVDAHTHPVWTGDRGAEIGRRLAGESYAAIAAEGGGILATVRATRGASANALAAETRRRLSRMLACGTTTVEAKTGYALTVEGELAALSLLQSLSGPDVPRIVPTLLAAHEVAPEYSDRREVWVDAIVNEILPEAAARGLARFCDVFCDEGAFTVAESRTILTAAKRLGLGLRIHADELARTGGAQLAAELHAASADHLLRITGEDIAALGRAGTVAILAPGTAWWIRSRPAPARALIEGGVAVAVASDSNPGTCLTESLAAVAAHACLDAAMTVEETLTAMTLNAAASLGLAAELGSLEVGKRADLVVLDAPDDRHLVYHWGVNLVASVVRDGRWMGNAP